jgi:hypothetical protein
MYDFTLEVTDVEYVLFLNSEGEYVALALDNSEEIALEIPEWY